jgi:hypothetical protein
MAVYNHCLEYARLLPYQAELIDIAAPPADGSSLADVRATLAKVRQMLGQLRSAAPAADEMAAAIKAYVERLAAQYRPRLTLTAGAGPLADFAYVNVASPLGPFGVMCWLDPGAVERRLTADFAALFGSTGGVPADKRAELERWGAEALDTLERMEESLIEAALEAGQDAPRRHDASPAAILGVTVANMAVAA